MAANEHESRLRLTGRDETGAAFRSAAQNMERFARQTEGLQRRQANDTQRILGGLTGFQRQFGRAAAAFGGGMLVRQTVMEYATLERQMGRIGHTAGVAQNQTRAIRENLFRVANATGTSFEGAREAYEKLVASTGDKQMADRLIEPVMRFVTATGTLPEHAATMAEALKNNLKFDWKDIKQGFDMIAASSNMGKFEAKDMAMYIQQLSGEMAAMGYTGVDGLAKVGAMLTVIRGQSGSAESAFTGFKDIVNKMWQPEILDKLAKMGVPMREMMMQAQRDGQDVFAVFMNGIRDLIAIKAKAGEPLNLSMIFAENDSRRAARAILDNWGKLPGLLKEVRESTGTADRQFADFAEDAASKIQRFENAWTKAKQNMGEGLIDMGAITVLERLAKVVQDLGKDMINLGKIGKEVRAGNWWKALEETVKLPGSMFGMAKKNEPSMERATDRLRKRAYWTKKEGEYEPQYQRWFRERAESGMDNRMHREYENQVRAGRGDETRGGLSIPDAPSGRYTGSIPSPKNQTDPGSATEKTGRDTVDELRQQRNMWNRYFSRTSLGGTPGMGSDPGGEGGGSEGGGGGGGGSGESGGSAPGLTGGSGGRYNGLGLGPRSGGGGGSRGGSGGGAGGGDSTGPIAPFRGGGGNDDAAKKGPQVMGRLMKDFGLTKEQAAGVVGNLMSESGLKAINEKNPVVPGSRGGFGWAQWTGPRRKQFEAWAAKKGLDVRSDEANYGFLAHELRTTQRGELARLKQTKTVDEAAQTFSGSAASGRGFLRPGAVHMGGRVRNARRAFGWNPSDEPGTPAVAGGAPAPSDAVPKKLPGGGNNLSRLPDSAVKTREQVDKEREEQRLKEQPAQPAAAPSAQQIEVKFNPMAVPGLRDRGVAQARREMDRDVRSARHTSFSDVGVA